jgi:hypothetical protein
MPKRIKEYSSSEEEEGEGERESSEEDVDSIPHKKQKYDSASSDVGIIEKIELENFMCHKRLEIGFGTNINFIVGVNGSMLLFCVHLYTTQQSHQIEELMSPFPTRNTYTQHATRNTQHATCNMQHATRNTQHATRNTQHATRNTQHATRNAQHATRINMQYQNAYAHATRTRHIIHST